MPKIHFNGVPVAAVGGASWNVRRTADGAVLDCRLTFHTSPVPMGVEARNLLLVPRRALVFAKNPVNAILGYATCHGAIPVNDHSHENTVDLALLVSREALVRVSEARHGHPLDLHLEMEFDIFADGRLAEIASSVHSSSIPIKEWLGIVALIDLSSTFLIELPRPGHQEHGDAPVPRYFAEALAAWERLDRAGVLSSCRRALEALGGRRPDEDGKRLEALLRGKPDSKEWTVRERAGVAEEALRLLLNVGAHHVDGEPTNEETAFALVTTAAVLRLRRGDAKPQSGE